MEDIEKNMKRLEWLLRVFPAKYFYSIRVSMLDVTLQGYMNAEVEKIAVRHGFEIDPTSDHVGYVRRIKGERFSEYRIILT